MGVMGGCTKNELHQMKNTNFNDLGISVLVTLPDSKTKMIRSFAVTGPYYKIYKQYVNLRPSNVNIPWFFINYQKGKCSYLRMGVNKLGDMGKEIAKYLKLPNHELYTGHCFLRSSTTILVDAGGVITTLQRNSDNKSTAVAEEYIVKSEEYIIKSEKIELDTDDTISNIPLEMENVKIEMPFTTTIENQHLENFSIQHSANSPKMIFNNCTFIFKNK